MDFFETIVVNLEPKNSKSLVDCCWYLDSSATKHVSGDKSSFKGLENSTKVQNLKSIWARFMVCMEKVTLNFPLLEK